MFFFLVVAVSRFVAFGLVCSVAEGSGAVECCWRESERSFSGFVAEVWFGSGAEARAFARGWAAVVGRSVLLRVVSGAAPGGWCVSVPCAVPGGAVVLSGGSRGGRARCRLVF